MRVTLAHVPTALYSRARMHSLVTRTVCMACTAVYHVEHQNDHKERLTVPLATE